VSAGALGRDLADLVARDRNVTLISHYMPAMGILRFNQLYPPFDKPEARRALLSVVDQAEAMTAVAGADPANWLDGIGLFSHGTPLANDAGIDILRRARDRRRPKGSWPRSATAASRSLLSHRPNSPASVRSV
jgi:peptide/nickel transport system substrate-binding protein